MAANEGRRRRRGWVWLTLLLAVAVAAWLLLWPRPLATPPVAGTPAPSPLDRFDHPAPPNVASGEIVPAERYPLPTLPPEAIDPTPLPALADSDAVLADALSTLLGDAQLAALVVPADLVRRIVVTVDNLPGERLPLSRAPLRPAPGSFQAEAQGGGAVIAAANAERYAAHVALAEALPADRLVALYVRLYPLFQAAYEELGYPGAQFNDRLVAVIDHLIAAPTVGGPVALVQPKIRYQFADARLEGLSAGHKIMLRIGPDHAARLKARLQAIRARLVAKPAGG